MIENKLHLQGFRQSPDQQKYRSSIQFELQKEQELLKSLKENL